MIKKRPLTEKIKVRTQAHFRRRRSRQRAIGMARILYLGLGVPLVIFGAVLAPTPLPIGIPIVIIGLFLIARGSRVARESIMRLRQKWPKFSAILNKLKSKSFIPPPVRRFLMRTDPLMYDKYKQSRNKTP